MSAATAPHRGRTASTVVARGLTKRFAGSNGVLAVDGLDLDVPAGSVFGLLGPNGAGKTTTLRLLTGLTTATSGTVRIDDREVRPDDLRGRAAIGVLEQSPRFYGWMRGRELVEFAARLAGLDPTDARARTSAVLARTGLGEAGERRIGGYSGGMRQRLGIAAALVAGPGLLILDEPVSALDPAGRRDLLALIADLRGSATVIFSTHVLADVERICDRVAVLSRGRLVAEGPLAALLARARPDRFRLEPAPDQEPAIAGLVDRLTAAPWCRAVTDEGTSLIVDIAPDGADRLLPTIVAAGLQVERFERVRASLEDVFLDLVEQPTGSAAADGPVGPGWQRGPDGPEGAR